MTVKHSRCEQLGVCQGLAADQCPDCDSFECEVGVGLPPSPPCPTYPFAPGVIEGPARSPLSRRALLADLLVLLAASAVLGALAGYLMGRLA